MDEATHIEYIRSIMQKLIFILAAGIFINCTVFSVPVILPGHQMSYKMQYLKTGQNIVTRLNYKNQQNFWGKGIPTKTQFPSHLAEWEEFRRKEAPGKTLVALN